MAKGITSHELRQIYRSEKKRRNRHKVNQTIFLSTLSVIATILFSVTDDIKNEESEN